MWKSPLKPGKRGSLLSDTLGMSFLSRAWPWIPWRRSSMRIFLDPSWDLLHSRHKDLTW
ncbi:hypothetical protein CORC01_10013 [Colletotrichum orchidophilum]|uniref:Uncharacterized protein n=1 Tax=Colletotrichum orchidophilum TaxID=1209926 RepID=A0A1G4AZZ0_9PEZI|nr:uncharacterized protein CORC01_10013 [Colletotrichum orchidophilum]OHE94704.1 hypothetical protein CORC01_10013 [Colletotrichum orchidophilum]